MKLNKMYKALRTCEIIADSTYTGIPKGEERKNYDNQSIYQIIVKKKKL